MPAENDSVTTYEPGTPIPDPDPAMFEAELTEEEEAAIAAIPLEPVQVELVGSYAVARAREFSGKCWPEMAVCVRWFNVDGAPAWCAYFVAYSFDTSAAGNKDHTVPWARYGSIGYTGTIHTWAQQTGRIVTTPLHGDIYGRTDEKHTGLVVGANPQGTLIYTINGNWSGGCVGYASWTKQGSVWVSGNAQIGRWFARY
jgi:hypothetical protein